MKNRITFKQIIYFMLYALSAIVIISSCKEKAFVPKSILMTSPNGTLEVSIQNDAKGHVSYTLGKGDKVYINKSDLGLNIKDLEKSADHWVISDTIRSSFEETWKPVLGRKDKVQNEYNELVLKMHRKEDKDKLLHLVFRLFDDGLGFRYEINKWSKHDSLIILDDETTFNLNENSQILWSVAHYKQYQKTYQKTLISEVDSTHTPVTIQHSDGTYISIHQAAIHDYPDMKLFGTESTMLKAKLTPWREGVAVKAQLPMTSPWRTIQVAKDANTLLNSYVIENLNEPLALKNIDYIKPYKYMGIWWEMHIGTHTWWEDLERHGATTSRTKRLIDFAADNNIDAILVEGWNVGKATDKADEEDMTLSYLEPTSDFDLKHVVNYAKSKGIDFIISNETIGKALDYEANMDEAYALYQELGITGIKSGYSGDLPYDEWRHGQYMVKHFDKVVQKAASYQLMVNKHEPVIPSGWDRTYPNYVTSEAVRGNEMEAWSIGNPIGHPVHLAYTRLLAGPMDYTPGIFDIRLQRYADKKVIWHPRDDGSPKRVHTTLAAQLALYVVLYSPWQMVSDLVENYEGNAAFQFIRDVPTTWDAVRVLSEDFGEHIVVARKHAENWFIGGVNAATPTTVKLDLSFLDDQAEYELKLYADGEATDYDTNPEAYEIKTMEVSADDHLDVAMTKGGGFAISIMKK